MQKKDNGNFSSHQYVIKQLENLPIFKTQKLSPMLLKSEDQPFNNSDYIFELKFDGFRCIAEITKENTSLHSRNGRSFNRKFPELINIHKQCSSPCILDGEIVFINNLGVPDFSYMQKRNSLSNETKIKNLAKDNPVTFVVFDIIACGGKDTTKLPLMKRKEILQYVVSENHAINICRYTENSGIDLFNAIKEKHLEGIVAKKKNSFYHLGKRRDDWVKIRVLPHDEYRQFNKPKAWKFLLIWINTIKKWKVNLYFCMRGKIVSAKKLHYKMINSITYKNC